MEKKEVQGIIDTEIKYLEKTETKPGWTIWAILPALGGLIFLILNYVSYTNHNFNIILYYVLLILLIYDLLQILVRTPGYDLNRPVRFLSNSSMFKLRRNIIQIVFRYALIIYLVSSLPFITNPYIKFPLLILYGLQILLLSVGYFFRPPANKKPDGSLKLVVVIWVLLLIFLIYGTSSVVKLSEINIGNLKIAVLIASVMYLFGLLIDLYTEDPYYIFLTNLNRDLNFNFIAPDEAYSQAETALYGQKISVYLQPKTLKLLNLYDLAHKTLRELDVLYQEYEKDKEHGSPLRLEMDKRILELEDIFKKISRRTKILVTYMKAIMKQAPEMKIEIESVLATIETYPDKFAAELTNFINKMKLSMPNHKVN